MTITHQDMTPREAELLRAAMRSSAPPRARIVTFGTPEARGYDRRRRVRCRCCDVLLCKGERVIVQRVMRSSGREQPKFLHAEACVPERVREPVGGPRGRWRLAGGVWLFGSYAEVGLVGHRWWATWAAAPKPYRIGARAHGYATADEAKAAVERHAVKEIQLIRLLLEGHGV